MMIFQLKLMIALSDHLINAHFNLANILDHISKKFYSIHQEKFIVPPSINSHQDSFE